MGVTPPRSYLLLSVCAIATLAGVCFSSCFSSLFEISLSRRAVTVAGGSSLELNTYLLLYRAPEKDPRLAQFAKLSCTGVYSLHHSLVST